MASIHVFSVARMVSCKEHNDNDDNDNDNDNDNGNDNHDNDSSCNNNNTNDAIHFAPFQEQSFRTGPCMFHHNMQTMMRGVAYAQCHVMC